MTTKAASAERRPFGIWFVAFVIAMIGAGALVTFAGIDDPVLAKGIMLVPLLFILKAGLNGIHNARLRPSAGGSANARYLARMLVVTFLYVGSLFAALALIDEGDPVTIGTIVLAFLPGLAVAAYFWAIARLMIELDDEFLRMLMVRQSLVATAIALSAASIYGFLENFEIVPHLAAFYWPIVWFAGLGVGAIVNKLTYGTTGEVR